MAMVSPRRVVVVGPRRDIVIYDLPEQFDYSDGVGNRREISLSPIWKWDGTDGSAIPDYRLSVSSVYHRASTPDLRLIHLFVVGTMHRMVVSPEGKLVVAEHEIIPNGMAPRPISGMPMGLRGVFWHGEADFVSSTLWNKTITEPSVTGCFHVQLGPRTRHSTPRFSVDEISGIVSFREADDDGDFLVYVADVNDLQ
jgi:hypothetical protein